MILKIARISPHLPHNFGYTFWDNCGFLVLFITIWWFKKGVCTYIDYMYILNNFSREFTHRVKSISMAKFTADEVSALQAAGNEVCMHI